MPECMNEFIYLYVHFVYCQKNDFISTLIYLDKFVVEQKIVKI